MEKKKILMIVGSLRRSSFNRQLANKIAAVIGDRADVSFLEYADMPFMNQDIEDPVPEAVSRAREEVIDADGIWICTAEYNFNIPGVLKNLLDWLSRPLIPGDRKSGTAVKGKPVAISGVGGQNATKNSREILTGLLKFMQMDVMETPQTGMAVGKDAFISDVLDLSDGSAAELRAQADAFLHYMQ